MISLFWDLIQDSDIKKQRKRTKTVETRMEALEKEVDDLRRIVHTLLQRLETQLGQDLNQDGKVG